MLKAIAITLGNGFEVALIISVIIIWLRHTGNSQLSRWVFGGTGFAIVVSWTVLYALKWSGPKKESFTGWVMALSILIEILFIIWVQSERKACLATENTVRIRPVRKTLGNIFVFLTAAFLTVLPLMHILLFPSSIFIQTYSVVNTELVLKFSGGLLGLIFCYIFGISFLRSTRTLPIRSSVIGSAVLLLALMLNELFTVVQILFARGVFPLTPLAMKILVPIINNMDKYLYVLLGASLLWTVMIIWSFIRRKEAVSEEWNSAVKRKYKARKRNIRRWLASIVGLMVIIPTLLGVEAVLANKTIELSPAEPVTPDANHQISIPQASVDDHNLHRFGYTAADGTIVRFIIIRK